jgi:uncharacterized protein HemX
MTAPRYKEGQGIALAQVHAQVRRLRRWVLFTALLAAVGAATAAYGFHRASQARQNVERLTLLTRAEARETTRSLCTLREDLERRAKASEAYLRENPRGIPGVPLRTLRDSLTNQQRTISALAGIDC